MQSHTEDTVNDTAHLIPSLASLLPLVWSSSANTDTVKAKRTQRGGQYDDKWWPAKPSKVLLVFSVFQGIEKAFFHDMKPYNGIQNSSRPRQTPKYHR